MNPFVLKVTTRQKRSMEIHASINYYFHFFLPSAKDGAKDEQGPQERLSLNVDNGNKWNGLLFTRNY